MKGSSSIKGAVIAGFALFSMFFGAGNLIFPPTLGLEAGDLWPLALAGFLLGDAVLASVGVYAVNKGGLPLQSMRRALGKPMGILVNSAAILCLCVFFAMPRTAATAFELSAAPFLGHWASFALLPFSLLFFALVYLLAFRQSRIVDIVGRFFTPALVLGMIVLIIVGIAEPLGPMQAPLVENVAEEGIRSGYQTMDVLGVVAFSIILLDSPILKSQKTQEGKARLLVTACLVATVLLGVIYGGLTYLGATASGFGGDLSQAALLTTITENLLGKPGIIILAIVVFLACITTAVALVSSAAAYFHDLLKGRFSYKALLMADCIMGVLICNGGLEAIIAVSHPVLAVVYPPLLTVVFLLLFQKSISSRSIYQGAALGACFGGLLFELPLSLIQEAARFIPLGNLGLAWIWLAALGGFVGWLLRRRQGI